MNKEFITEICFQKDITYAFQDSLGLNYVHINKTKTMIDIWLLCKSYVCFAKHISKGKRDKKEDLK